MCYRYAKTSKKKVNFNESKYQILRYIKIRLAVPRSRSRSESLENFLCQKAVLPIINGEKNIIDQFFINYLINK